MSDHDVPPMTRVNGTLMARRALGDVADVSCSLAAARTMQGMARVRSGRPRRPVVSDRSVRRGSGVKCDFVCTSTRCLFRLRPVVLRPRSRLRLEGRTPERSAGHPRP